MATQEENQALFGQSASTANPVSSLPPSAPENDEPPPYTEGLAGHDTSPPSSSDSDQAPSPIKCICVYPCSPGLTFSAQFCQEATVHPSRLEMIKQYLKELPREPLSMESIISYAYSAKLIEEKLMNDVLGKNPMSQFERTLLLLRNIGEKMHKPEEATVVMRQFLEILESNPTFRPFVKKIRTACEEKPNSEKAVFDEQQHDLARILQFSIRRVASAALDRDLISSDIKDAAVNTRTEHDKLQLHRIKKEIDKQIMSDPEKMKAFFEQIAKDIEPSLQHLSTIPAKSLEGAPMDTS